MSAPSGAIITTPRLAETRDYTQRPRLTLGVVDLIDAPSPRQSRMQASRRRTVAHQFAGPAPATNRTNDQELKATSTELAPSRLHDLLLTTLLIKIAGIVMSGS